MVEGGGVQAERARGSSSRVSAHEQYTSWLFIIFFVNACGKQLVGSRGSEKGQNGLTQREDGASELLGG